MRMARIGTTTRRMVVTMRMGMTMDLKRIIQMMRRS
jgi:hypothetical protein